MHDLPLEDTFGDILRKGMRGTGIDETMLGARTGIERRTIEAWLHDRDAADDAQAAEVARVLRLDARKLADRAADRWYPPPVRAPGVHRHAQHPHPSNGYAFVDGSGEHAALVDPAGEPNHLLRVLRDGGYRLAYVLITHKHADHCDAAGAIAQAFPDATIAMHPLDLHAIGSLAARAHRLRDTDALPFGDGVIAAMHTPGHTDGSVCFLHAGTLFTGDTLFAGSVGGAYGDDSTYDDILTSVRDTLFTLPGETTVMPGHGPPTTIAQEQAHNPFL